MKTVWFAMGVLAAAGCGSDLGECKHPQNLQDPRYVHNDVNGDGMAAVEEYVFPGQALINGTCAGGRCHSASAVGISREGAPATLDFDVPSIATTPAEEAALTAGRANVSEYADDIWSHIQDGTMPPDRPIPAQEKEDIRNWLACGAPIPPAPTGPAPTNGFETAFPGLANACNGCHMVASPAFGNYAVGPDVCTAYNNLQGGPSASAACGGNTLVVPQNAGASLLLNKLTASPLCGAPMPFGAMQPFAVSNPTAFQALEQWIADGAPKPEACP